MSEWKQYRKLPVVISAKISDENELIHTLEGFMLAHKGDYIICGVKGELYPCKPDIFKQTYEEVKEGDK